MADNIKYGIFPNPLPDEEGKTTYQVRHMPDGTMNEKSFLAHLKYHNTYNTIMMQSSLSVLKNEIIEQLRNNKRFRIDGIGTFQMQYALNITEYRAQKWLDELTAEEFSKYYCKKQGSTYVYYRYGWE